MIENKVNEAILGGLVVDLGDGRTVDLSVSSKVNKLNAQIAVSFCYSGMITGPRGSLGTILWRWSSFSGADLPLISIRRRPSKASEKCGLCSRVCEMWRLQASAVMGMARDERASERRASMRAGPPAKTCSRC